MAAANFNIYAYITWLKDKELQDGTEVVKYLASFYWAIVSVNTVGYGDIVPKFFYEKVYCCFIFIFGGAFYSYIISSFSS